LVCRNNFLDDERAGFINMVFIVKMTKEDLQKIRDEIYEGNKINPDEELIRRALYGEFSQDIEVLKIAD